MSPCPPNRTSEPQLRPPNNGSQAVAYTPPTIPKGARLTVEVNGRPVSALLDLGSTVTLARPAILPAPIKSVGTLAVSCVQGDARSVPTAQVKIRSKAGEWPLLIGLLPDLPVSLLLGHDWLGFAATMKATAKCGPEQKQKGRDRRACMARGDRDASNSSPGEPQPQVNPLSSLFQQATQERGFGKEQKEDDWLKHCWGQVLQVEGVNTDPAWPLPPLYFLVRNGLLYFHTDRRGEPCDLLVVPRQRTPPLLHLAHTHPLGGHLGPKNTLEKLRDRFTWPGMNTKVLGFCRACATCQQTSPLKPAPAPLIPLPIIGVPFERLGMDLIGPLPKSARGHEYILVMVDYATRYPEAVPLRKATSQSVARELLLLFSRVGIPKDILSDQGTPFMSKLMMDLCRLLQLKHLRTSVYHPQTDSLVERFNQTLKSMLRKVVDQEGWSWDLLLPFVLFAIRETPQASTGFTPVWGAASWHAGRCPRGLGGAALPLPLHH
ncbi:uncharacterized protein LOC132861438 [Tachysurus vachellii]|uniref:uncharacterized protein LOC132861438 n=1 Tax=Tachysurus vachellii TaxID=175792 RepID=UPI00296B27EB|nr:uncharacterized protein LOC132861438 [Tachysurus vachellii]